MMDHRYLMTMVKKRHLAGIFVFTSSTNHASVRAEMIFFFSFGRFLVIFDTFLVLFCPKWVPVPRVTMKHLGAYVIMEDFHWYLKNLIFPEKWDISWKMRYFLENETFSEKWDISWKMRHFLKNETFHGQQFSRCTFLSLSGTLLPLLLRWPHPDTVHFFPCGSNDSLNKDHPCQFCFTYSLFLWARLGTSAVLKCDESF